MIRLFKNIFFKLKLKSLINQACKIRKTTGRKQLVIIFNGEPVLLSKQDLTKMIRQGKFRKGVTVQEIEKMALFITRP